MYFGLEKQRDSGGAEVPNSVYSVNNIYLDGVRIAAVIPSGDARYYLTDQVDSVKVVADDNGLAVSRMEYMPYGETWFEEGDTNNAPKYNSQELDTESNFYYYNARHYSQDVARFVTADTVIDGEMDTQGWNRYAYCKGNPMEYKDPTGHAQQSAVIDPDDGGGSGSWLGNSINSLKDKANNITSDIKKKVNDVTEKTKGVIEDVKSILESKPKGRAYKIGKSYDALISELNKFKEADPTVGPAEIMKSFTTNSENVPEYVKFGPNSNMTKVVKNDEGVNRARESYKKTGMGGYHHDINPGKKEFVKFHLRETLQGEFTTQFLGRYDVEMAPTPEGKTLFVVSNKTGRASATRSTDNPKESLFKDVSRDESKFFGTIHQKYYWKE